MNDQDQIPLRGVSTESGDCHLGLVSVEVVRGQPIGAERHPVTIAVVHAPATQQQFDEPSPQRTLLRIIAADEELGRPDVKSGAA